MLADGDGYVRPRELLLTGAHVPTAEFPPLHPGVLAFADVLGITSPTGHRIVGALLGTVTVLLIGLLARRLAGPRAGVIAAGIAALSPVLIENDTSLQAEGLFMLLLAGSLLAIHVLMRRPPRPLPLLLLGLLLGATALTRSEALLLVPVAAVLIGWQPAARRCSGRSPRPSGSWRSAPSSSSGRGRSGARSPWAASCSPRRTRARSWPAATATPVYQGPQKGLWRLDCVTRRRHHGCRER